MSDTATVARLRDASERRGHTAALLSVNKFLLGRLELASDFATLRELQALSDEVKRLNAEMQS